MMYTIVTVVSSTRPRVLLRIAGKYLCGPTQNVNTIIITTVRVYKSMFTKQPVRTTILFVFVIASDTDSLWFGRVCFPPKTETKIEFVRKQNLKSYRRGSNNNKRDHNNNNSAPSNGVKSTKNENFENYLSNNIVSSFEFSGANTVSFYLQDTELKRFLETTRTPGLGQN